MRILLVSSFYPPKFIGGAELIAHEQAKVLLKRGHEVHAFVGVFATDGRYQLSEDVFEGIQVTRIQLTIEDSRHDRVTFHHPEVDRAFIDKLAAFQPDIVYSHNLAALSTSLPLTARHRGSRVVQMLHDHWGFCFKNTLIKSAAKICDDTSRCWECLPVISDGAGRGLPIEVRNDYVAHVLDHVSALVAPSEYLLGAYRKANIGPARVEKIAYGIDTARFGRCLRRPDGVTRFTFIGYLGEHKGVWPLVRAAAQLRDLGVGPDVVIRIVGVGHTEPALRQYCEREGLHDRVEFTGRVTNDSIDGILETSDVLILPSIWPENQPVTILEAMAAGLPVIASALGGIPEMVEPGLTGLLIPPDDPVALARQIVYLAEQPAVRAAMGERARAKIGEWNLENQVAHLETLFESVNQTEPTAPELKHPLVLCSAQHFGSDARMAIDTIRRQLNPNAPRFILKEWLEVADRRRASVYWIVGDTDIEADLCEAAQLGLPLLVPARNTALVEYCRQHSAGLWYRDADEAVAAITAFLLRASEEPDLTSPSDAPGPMRAGTNVEIQFDRDPVAATTTEHDH